MPNGSFIENVNKLANSLPDDGFVSIESKLLELEEREEISVDQINKLDAIQNEATKNSTDVQLRDRSSHTGTQTLDTITETASRKIFTKDERDKLSLVDLNNPPVHIHPMSAISGLEAELADKSQSTHNHDIRYYLKEQLDLLLSQKSDDGHNHNFTYFTKSEVDDLLSSYATILQTYSKIEVTQLLSSKEDRNMKGQAGGYAELDGNGRVLAAQLPSLSVVDVFEAPSEESMLLLSNVHIGDFCVRSDLSTNNVYMLKQTPSTSISNWIRLSFSATVASVNGQMGIVELTKSDIGLGNVDNTSDTNKPISTIQQSALDDKSDIDHNHDNDYEPKNTNIQSHINSSENPHSVTKSQVGLSNVDNTSDVAKPISTATQTALSDRDLANFLDFKF
jgi:hypothetical protein